MKYEDTAIQIANTFEKCKEENSNLRRALAIQSNENYFFQNKCRLLVDEMKALQKIKKDNGDNIENLNSVLAEVDRIREELNFYKNSNTYKVWIRYRKLPEPLRKTMRMIFIPFVSFYKLIRRK